MQVDALAEVSVLHHAYLVVGEGGADAVAAALTRRGVSVTQNSDYLTLSFGDLSIDDVRDTILPRVFVKSLSSAKYLIIIFNRCGIEAQNALLKAVEEGAGNTHFFFCSHSSAHFIETLRSRCIEVTTGATPELEDARVFLALPHAARLKEVDVLIKELQKTDDREPVRAFVRALIRTAHTAAIDAPALRTLLEAEAHLRLTGGSPKLVLTHLAVSLPIVAWPQ